MATTICDIAAFDYWRIPPIVHLLLAGEEDDVILRKIATVDEVATLRAQVVDELPLCKLYLRTNAHTRSMGAAARELLPVIALVAAGHEGAVDVLVKRHSKCHGSALLRPRLWSHELPSGSELHLYDEVSVASPELVALQLAGRGSLARTVMIASELCGSFAVFSPPAHIKAFLQRILDRDKPIPTVGGWRPFVDSGKQLGTLWSRPALTTPQRLASFAEACDLKRGASRLAQAASLVKAGAASPFEVQAAVLLGFSRRMGGYGLDGFEANGKVALNVGGRALAQRSCCYCDLFWEEAAVDVECQSILVHQNAGSFLSDSERTAALKGMGIDVLPITFDQLKDPVRLNSFAKVLSGMLGVPFRARTQAMEKAASRLRREVLVDWETVQQV